MDASNDNEAARLKNPTTVNRTSDRELVVTRTVNGPARLVYQAWTRPELFREWWVPKSACLTLLSCEQDVRVGGGYRLVFSHEGSSLAFFGTYLEVVPNARLVWTNEEAGDAGQVSTVTFEEKAGKTVVTLRELYPSKEALDEAITCGSQNGMEETFDQLDEFVVGMAGKGSA